MSFPVKPKVAHAKQFLSIQMLNKTKLLLDSKTDPVNVSIDRMLVLVCLCAQYSVQNRMAGIDANYKLEDITCKICNDAFTNARDLTCGHTFCLHCLENKRLDQCPECKEKTVPEENELKNLKPNSEKNKLVGLEIAARGQCEIK